MLRSFGVCVGWGRLVGHLCLGSDMNLPGYVWRMGVVGTRLWGLGSLFGRFPCWWGGAAGGLGSLWGRAGQSVGGREKVRVEAAGGGA